MRLIDVDSIPLKEALKRESIYDHDRYIHVKVLEWMLENAPTVDAVPVIRCKDCKWGKEVCGNIECWADMNLPPECHGYYWYCPNGERKEE